MKSLGLPWLIGGWLAFAWSQSAIASDQIPPLEPPVTASPDETARPVEAPDWNAQTDADRAPGQSRDEPPALDQGEGPFHEAFLPPGTVRETVHIDQAPPVPIVERPGVDAPSPEAQWIEGYWDWDQVRRDFVWVTGIWRTPPPGRFWVNGYWRRDDQGWSRVPGFWSERKTDRINIEKNGPPADHPPDEMGEAPGPDYFYIPGQYVPVGDSVTWRPGFWAKAQPGWEWIPAHWVRRSGGWVYREGHWEPTSTSIDRVPRATLTGDVSRARAAAPSTAPPTVAGSSEGPAIRHDVARPVPGEAGQGPFRGVTPGPNLTEGPDGPTDLQPIPDRDTRTALPAPYDRRSDAGVPGNGPQVGSDPPSDLRTRLVVDPRTGLWFDPLTGLVVDPRTGLLIDPRTGRAIDPRTGLPVAPARGPRFVIVGPPFGGPIEGLRSYLRGLIGAALR